MNKARRKNIAAIVESINNLKSEMEKRNLMALMPIMNSVDDLTCEEQEYRVTNLIQGAWYKLEEVQKLVTNCLDEAIELLETAAN